MDYLRIKILVIIEDFFHKVAMVLAVFFSYQ